jgi:hypothetical protein
MFNSRIAALFDELPMLCGFTVSPDLEEVQIAVHTWPGWDPGRELTDEVRAALEDLIADGPDETTEQLRGRTFARAIH